MVKLYVEGGGDVDLLRNQCREGFRRFLEAAGVKGRMPRIVASGSREMAFNNFLTAVAHPRSGELPLLLVDSEAPVADGATVWQHLKTSDGWMRPEAAGDDQAFLMVQCMEAWFLADRETLADFFGKEFNGNTIPQWKDLEAVGKSQILKALRSATARCERKPYEKGKVSFDLLGRIDPAKVESVGKHAKALLERLRREQISGQSTR